MKKIKLIFVFILVLSCSFTYAQKQTVKTDKSEIVWVGKKIGGKHTGNIQLESGEFKIKKDVVINGHFIIDMTSITNTDIKDKKYNKKLVDHLKSDDFFGVSKFPTANFKITNKAEFINNYARITGNITIKGITKPISFNIKRHNDKYTATIKIDRSMFNVRYGSNSFFDNLGNKVIDDIFILHITIGI